MPTLHPLRPGWGDHRRMGAALREVFGEYRAPTGVAARVAANGKDLVKIRAEVERVSRHSGGG